MTSLFCVFQFSDYIDSCESDTIFYSLNKEEAITFAKDFFLKTNIEKNVKFRPNLLEYYDQFLFFINKDKAPYHFHKSVFVKSVPLSTCLTSAKNNVVVWNPCFEDVKNIFKLELNRLVFMDLNTTLSDEELDELTSIFIKNHELFREQNKYGVVKHSSELLKLLSSHDTDYSFLKIENSFK